MTSSTRRARRRAGVGLAGPRRLLGIFLLLLAAAWQPAAAADEDTELSWRSAAEIFELLERSKTKYNLDVKAGDEAFLEELREPPADVTGRPQLTATPGATDLTTWVCGEQAEEQLAEAEVAFGNDDMATAQAGYRRAVASDPECYVAHSHLGDTFLKTDNETMALAHYSRAIELNPIDHKTYAYRGHAYLRTGDAGLALADFQKALALRPHYWLVEALVGNYTQARLDLRDARLLAPVRITRTGRRSFDIEVFSDSEPWLAYGLCAAAWQGEGLSPLVEERSLEPRALRKTRRVKARERDAEGPRFELALERECMTVALSVYVSGRQADETTERPVAADPVFEALERAARNDYFDEALLYGVAAQRFAQTMLLLGEPARERMLDYVKELVLTRR